MGTNYYVVRNRPSLMEPVHIGKSSGGWLFCFQEQDDSWHDPPVVWHTYDQVMEWLRKWTVETPDFVIINEYDEIVTYEWFKHLVAFLSTSARCVGDSSTRTTRHTKKEAPW